MSDPQSNVMWPKFRFSLTADQTLNLGRLTVIWGQIDHFVLNSVALLLTRDLAAGITLLGDTTTGPLANKLSKSRHRVADLEIRKLIKNFCDDMSPLIVKRNHLMHGIWGFYLPGKDATKAKPGCFFAKNPHNPVFPEEIADLANKAAAQTHVISRIWHHIAGVEFPEGNPSYYFGQHEPTPPEGLKLVQVAMPPQGHSQ